MTKLLAMSCALCIAVTLATYRRAAAAPSGCSPTTKLYFGNGVANTRLDAQQAMWSLVPLAEEAGVEDFEVALAYNPTDGMLLDVVETLKQKIAEDDRFSWYLANNILGYTLRGLTIPQVIARRHAPLVEAIQDYVNDAIATASSHPTPFYDETVREHVDQYLHDVSHGHRAIVVAHSQGNLYANSAHGLLSIAAPTLASSFGIVAVATPAETALSGYVTSNNDLVIGWLRSLGKTVLPANLNVLPSPSDLSGHQFLATYLDPNRPARARVTTLLAQANDAVHFRSAVCNYGDGELSAFLGTGEEQSYEIELTAGQGANFRVAKSDDSGLWPGITLHDPTGAEVDSASGTEAAGVSFSVPLTGSYTIVIRDTNSGVGEPGHYDLYWAIARGANEGGLLSSGGVVSDTIDKGDLDSYTFTALAGEGIELRLANIGTGSLWPGLRVYDASGTLVDSASGTEAAGVTFAALSSGTHTVVISDAAYGVAGVGAYDLHFTRAPSANEGGALTSGGVVSSVIDRGDLDSYTFTAEAGEGIMLRLANVDSGDMWSGFRVYDPAGSLVQAVSHIDVTGLAFAARSSGTYTVVISDAAYGVAGVGAYDLYFTRAPGANEHGAVSSGTSVTGVLDLGDLDSFSFPTVAGLEIAVQVADDGVTSLWPGLRMYDPSGKEVAVASGIDLAKGSFVAKVSGTYTLVVYDSAAALTGVGGYTVTITEALADP